MRTFLISICLNLVIQCAVNTPQIINVGQYLIDLVDLAQTFCSEKMQVMNDINI